jgi:hypothetical protein
VKLFNSLLVLALGMGSAGAHAEESIEVATPRGAMVEIIAEKPAGPGPFPAVVIASGAGYDMRQPIIRQAAEALLSQGIAVYRFDWAYRVAGTEYSAQPKDRSSEIEDMRTVLALARQDPGIDTTRIAVGGKSLGSIIAWRLLREDSELKGALLLTPPCSRPDLDDAGRTNFPALEAEQRSRLWIVGDIDPLCPVTKFHRFMSAGVQADRTAVVSGDHNYRSPDRPERDQPTLDLVLHIVSDFASTLLAPAK